MNEPTRSTSNEKDRRVALGWVAGQLRWESRLDGLRNATSTAKSTAKSTRATARRKARKVQPAA